MPRSTPKTDRAPAGAAGLSGEQIDRLADLIAEGRAELPDDLPGPDLRRLTAAVRRRLRDRLVRLIARAVACRLHGQGRPGKEDDDDARTQV